MACTMAALAPAAVRPMAGSPLKQAKNTFAARTVSNGSIKKVSANMQGKQSPVEPAAARPPSEYLQRPPLTRIAPLVPP